MLIQSELSYRVILPARRAGLTLSYHKLRKGFGCRLAKTLGRGSEAKLHEIMRHSSMQVTMDFYVSVDVALQDSINVID